MSDLAVSRPHFEVIATSNARLAWRRFKRHRLALVSGAVLLVLGLAVVFADLLPLADPRHQDLQSILRSPSRQHWLGTDHLGRDVLSRVVYGGRVSLSVGLTVALSSGVIGTIVGALSGFYGGWIDSLLMRVTDLFLSIPLLVVLIVASSILGGSVLDVILILTMFFWMYSARVVRAVMLSLKQKEFVEAAKTSGASDIRIIVFHMLPNTAGPLTVSMALGVAAAILTESALSFLAFGIQPPTPSWGNLLNDAQNFSLTHPWLVWSPGLVILVTVLAVNFVGDGLRDALDPHQVTARVGRRR